MSLFYATLALFQGKVNNLAEYLPTVTSKSLSADCKIYRISSILTLKTLN